MVDALCSPDMLCRVSKSKSEGRRARRSGDKLQAQMADAKMGEITRYDGVAPPQPLTGEYQ